MFNIKIPVPDEKDAFDLLAWQIRRLDWYVANNRSNRLDFFKDLKKPLVDKMIEDRNTPCFEFHDKYFAEFCKAMYDKKAYDDKIKFAKEAIEKLQPCFERCEKLAKSWGFEILPEYHVDINLYGIGGSYHRDKNNIGHIMCGVNTKNKTEFFARLLGHEMIHLGIENLIINPEHTEHPRISQEEKKRIVDILCIYAMDGILPLYRPWSNGTKSQYQEVAKDASYMDKVIGTQPETNLVEAVNQFLKGKNMRIIERDNPIFQSEKFSKDAVAMNIMVSLVENPKEYPTVRCFSDGTDCIIVNSDPKHPVCVWTSDEFKDFEKLHAFIQKTFADNEPLTITSKKDFQEFLQNKNAVKPNKVEPEGAYFCAKTNDIPYVGFMDSAKEQELTQVANLVKQFYTETSVDKNITQEECMQKARDFMGKPLYKVWRNPDGKIVALSRIRLMEKYGRIGLVITATNERGKSYAKMLVHALTNEVLKQGKIPTLFTDFNYPASNKCYQAVGYQLCAVVAEYELFKSA